METEPDFIYLADRGYERYSLLPGASVGRRALNLVCPYLQGSADAEELGEGPCPDSSLAAASKK